ncbi:hypothetical protein [Flavobacterium sp.]|uniref:toxin-antitoxin system YwqK family antitoxin n=1 Tax=Flavobacterium sp. TaxID=239 RepID=UPI0026356C63|nr:hypothetical protein [Flavobacterium sp.]
MKNLNMVLLPLLLLLPMCLIAQQRIYFDKDWKETTQEKAVYYRTVAKQDQLFAVTDFYRSGIKQFEGVSSTDKEPLILEGKASWYNEKGVAVRIGQFKNGVREGEMTEYYGDGQLMSKGHYANNKLNGEYAEYFSTGGVSNRANFIDDVIDGIHEKFSAEDRIEFRMGYKKGVLSGDYEFYNSSGKLFNKGTVAHDFQEGTCYDYYYSGKLRNIYTIKDKLLEGTYIMLGIKGDTATVAHFKKGVALDFRATDIRVTNNSIFGAKMVLKDGIEHWKVYRDKQLVLESFYREGRKTGIWKIYSYDGQQLLRTHDYTHATCAEQYLQGSREKFDPFLKLSPRFHYDDEVLKGECEFVAVNLSDEYNAKHPFYYMKDDVKPKPTTTDSDIVDYHEPADDAAFREKNHCSVDDKDNGLYRCKRTISKINYTVFASRNVAKLQALQSSYKPKDNEIAFFYQTFESRLYDFSKEKRVNRYMGFALPAVLKQAIATEKFDDIEVMRALEYEFFTVDTFSGFAAMRALEEAVK